MVDVATVVIALLLYAAGFCSGVHFGEQGIVRQLVGKWPNRFRWSERDHTMYYKIPDDLEDTNG